MYLLTNYEWVWLNGYLCLIGFDYRTISVYRNIVLGFVGEKGTVFEFEK